GVPGRRLPGHAFGRARIRRRNPGRLPGGGGGRRADRDRHPPPPLPARSPDAAARDLRPDPGHQRRGPGGLRLRLPAGRHPRPAQRLDRGGRLDRVRLPAVPDRRGCHRRRRALVAPLPDQPRPRRPRRGRRSGAAPPGRGQRAPPLHHGVPDRGAARRAGRRGDRALPRRQPGDRRRHRGPGLRGHDNRRPGQPDRGGRRLAAGGAGAELRHLRRSQVLARLHLHRARGRARPASLGPFRRARAVIRVPAERVARAALLGLALLALVTAPYYRSPGAEYVAGLAVIAVLFALSYNLLLGTTGLVSFGHAAFYGIGAFTVALLATRLHASALLGLALAPIVGAGVGLAVGAFCLRAVHLYFSLLTLAVSQLLYVAAFEADTITGGDNGIHGIPIPDFLNDPTAAYFFVLAVVAAGAVLLLLITRSPFGAALNAIRENRQRAAFVGLSVRLYELAAFTIASSLAAVAGALYAIYDQQAFAGLLFWTESGTPVLMALIGGMR